jgi:DNA-binding IclR family transcriptional regulator
LYGHTVLIVNRGRLGEVMATESLEKADNVRAVGRALEILLAFTASDRELTIAELLKRVDLSRPTLYRLLHTLEQSRFVIAEGEPKRVRLGPAVARLAHAWNASHDVSAVAEPMMRRVWEASGETVAVFVRDGVFRTCLAELPSPHALSFRRGVGYRERLAVGASGRVILAHMNLMAADLKAYHADRRGDPERYLKELARVRERGFAVSHEELLPGAAAVAAPFFDSTGQVAGALGVFGPSARLSPLQTERYGKLLIREARALSEALGSP